MQLKIRSGAEQRALCFGVSVTLVQRLRDGREPGHGVVAFRGRSPCGFSGLQWQGQINVGVGLVSGDIQRKWCRVAVQLKQRAIRQQSAGLADDQFPHWQKGFVDLEAVKAPRVCEQAFDAQRQLLFVVSVLPLEVLGAQQHALLPDDLQCLHVRVLHC